MGALAPGVAVEDNAEDENDVPKKAGALVLVQ